MPSLQPIQSIRRDFHGLLSAADPRMEIAVTKERSPVSITILVDNNTVPGMGLVAEHGFSALIDREKDRVLFDTGQGPALVHNSRSLGIDLAGLDAVALSHGHYDHTGGLQHVVRLNPGVKVFAHPKALSPHFVKRQTDLVPREIGMPCKPEGVTAACADFQLVTTFSEILDRVWFTGKVPGVVHHEPDTRLLVQSPTGFSQDFMEDDASLLLQTASGPVLLLGCAHAGVRNILDHVKRKAGIDQIHAIIGGTHLGFSPERETEAVIREFDRFGVQCVATAHCTGVRPNQRLQEYFGDRFHHAWAGTVFTF